MQELFDLQHSERGVGGGALGARLIWQRWLGGVEGMDYEAPIAQFAGIPQLRSRLHVGAIQA